MKKRLKILVSAYACSPYKGSEPGVGWGFVAELAKHHDLWVMVEEEKFLGDIERYLADNPGFADNVHFYFIRKQRNRRLRKLWPPSYYWYYRRWHRKAVELGKELHREIGFDVAHQLTMVGFREPGYLWRLGIPFVWGPVGGMGFFPWRFLPMLDLKGAIYYLAYNLFNWRQMRFSSRPKKAALIAGSGLIAATPENQLGAARYWGNVGAQLMSEVGLPPVQALEPCLREPDQSLQVIWVGQHTPGKALNLALEALAKLPSHHHWHLQVLGKGECTDSWQQLVRQLGIVDKVTFHGWLQRDQAMHIMQKSHVMLITSLRDLTSTVTIEALAQGLPIVCLDHCGFAGVVNEDCGIKVPVISPKVAINGIRDAVARLEADEPLRRQLALGAMQRARDFSWESKVETLNRIYADVIGAQGSDAR